MLKMNQVKRKKKEIYSYNTAITRKSISAPTKYLLSKNLLTGSILDFGCGKGYDSYYLKSKGYDVTSYEPHWNPLDYSNKKYNTIICNYVLNVLNEEDEKIAISKILSALKPGGTAFISVRRDLKKEGWTSRGLQRNVKLNFDIVYEKRRSFAIYSIQN